MIPVNAAAPSRTTNSSVSPQWQSVAVSSTAWKALRQAGFAANEISGELLAAVAAANPRLDFLAIRPGTMMSIPTTAAFRTQRAAITKNVTPKDTERATRAMKAVPKKAPVAAKEAPVLQMRPFVFATEPRVFPRASITEHVAMPTAREQPGFWRSVMASAHASNISPSSPIGQWAARENYPGSNVVQDDDRMVALQKSAIVATVAAPVAIGAWELGAMAAEGGLAYAGVTGVAASVTSDAVAGASSGVAIRSVKGFFSGESLRKAVAKVFNPKDVVVDAATGAALGRLVRAIPIGALKSSAVEPVENAVKTAVPETVRVVKQVAVREVSAVAGEVAENRAAAKALLDKFDANEARVVAQRVVKQVKRALPPPLPPVAARKIVAVAKVIKVDTAVVAEKVAEAVQVAKKVSPYEESARFVRQALPELKELPRNPSALLSGLKKVLGTPAVGSVERKAIGTITKAAAEDYNALKNVFRGLK